ncbi:MAG: lipid-A-disaccharide synthase [Chitinophagaceae bacterium]|nr:MAG: lipid-A-disaccharide synthase [Chitinophagaceae bacterium]
MKYYLIAGEASGDLHGSNLAKELRRQDESADLRGWGGDLMEAAGVTLVKHYRDLAFMGFVEVLMNLRTILRNLAFCKEDILRHRPDVLVLIDYPGFNLRVAEWAKTQGIRVVYYISPQVWAWKESRVKKIRATVDKMLVILPFEQDWYRTRWDYSVEFVGHPLMQVVNEFLAEHRPEAEYLKPVIALLPGSRKQEVAVKLPVMLEAARAFPDYQFVVAKAASLEEAFYQEILKEHPGVLSVRNDTYALLAEATAALVTSGTATLETALFGVPQVVCYKGSNISYQIAKRLVKIKYISLVNLIMDRPVVTELIQGECNPAAIERELRLLLFDEQKKAQVKNDYYELKQLLQQGGNASEKAAAAVIATVNPQSA